MASNPKSAQTEENRDQILNQLRGEFLIDARERLDEIAHELDQYKSAGGDAEKSLLAIRRQCHSLKGMGGSFEFPTITLVAHRLEDYLARAHTINSKIAGDIEEYCQCLLNIIATGEDPGPEKAADLIPALPAFSLFEVEEIVPLITEVMLVTPSKTIGTIVGRELAECGYKVTRFANAWEAMQFAASTRPNLVITAAVMDVIDGVNLARALSAMEPTQGIPVAVITSLDTDSRELENLPTGIAVVRHGANFSDELAEMLAGFETGDTRVAVGG